MRLAASKLTRQGQQLQKEEHQMLCLIIFIVFVLMLVLSAVVRLAVGIATA